MPSWRIEITDQAEAALLRLDKPVRLRILQFIRERLQNHPDPMAIAEPLTGEFKGLFRFRVGDYRLISDVQQHKLVIVMVDVRHRSEAYRKGL